jgi:hypothetical protein
MKKAILKNVLALALGGAISSMVGVKIDPDHFGKSVKELGTQAAMGAGLAVIGLNVRAPKDE